MSPKQYERGLDIIPIAQVAGLRLREGKSPPEREPLSPQLPYARLLFLVPQSRPFSSAACSAFYVAVQKMLVESSMK